MAKADNGVTLPQSAGNKGNTNALPVNESLPAQRTVPLGERKIAQMDGSYVTISGTIREDR